MLWRHWACVWLQALGTDLCHPKNGSADPSFRAVKDVGLRPLASYDCGFESRRRHRCLSVVNVVCCHVEVSASGWSLVQGSPTDSDGSVCKHDYSTTKSPWPTRGFCAILKNYGSGSFAKNASKQAQEFMLSKKLPKLWCSLKNVVLMGLFDEKVHSECNFMLSGVFFWDVLRRMKFSCQRFGTLCLFHLHRRVETKCDSSWEICGAGPDMEENSFSGVGRGSSR
jgi:hypothetical protein